MKFPTLKEETIMNANLTTDTVRPNFIPWNKDRLIGQKPPLKLRVGYNPGSSGFTSSLGDSAKNAVACSF